jgi:HSP20 family protein
MSSRSNPFEDPDRMFARMSRQFEEAARRWGDEDWGLFGAGGDLAIDLVDRDDAFVVTVDVPGFDRNEIDLRVSDQTLWIEGDRREEAGEEAESYLRRERRHESMRRSIRLPAAVKPSEVTAKLRNGILTVTIPKAEPASESRKVEIEGE